MKCSRKSMPPVALITCLWCIAAALGGTPASLLEDIKSVGPQGRGNVQAARSMRELSAAEPSVIPDVLAAFDSASPVAVNYLRSAVETIADRSLAADQPLPLDELKRLAADRRRNPRARRLAWELVRRVDPSAADRLLVDMLDDPSPELRRDAVQRKIDLADGLLQLVPLADGDHKQELSRLAAEACYAALSGAVDDDQVKAVVGPLAKLGHKVDLREHFGFITRWHAVGPFDNRELKGFDAVYPPERQLDLGAAYEGQLGTVKWQTISTDHEYGIVDIAKEIENYKGSCMYLAAEVDSPRRQIGQVRLGTPNTWKLWLNGEFLFGREEYHRGMKLDQYRVDGELRAGKNTILVKICQNEQPEDWAQRYQFQLRVCDPAGAALDRPSPASVTSTTPSSD